AAVAWSVMMTPRPFGLLSWLAPWTGARTRIFSNSSVPHRHRRTYFRITSPHSTGGEKNFDEKSRRDVILIARGPPASILLQLVASIRETSHGDFGHARLG